MGSSPNSTKSTKSTDSESERLYCKATAQALQDCAPLPNVANNLYVIDYRLVRQIAARSARSGNRLEWLQCTMGFLTRKMLPSVNAFPIFTRVGVLEVTVRLVGAASPYLLMDQRQVNLARTYHSRVLQTVAHVPFDMDTNGAAPSLLLVPICRDYARVAQIDWNTMENFIRCPNPYSLVIQCQSYLTPKYFLMTSNCQRMLAAEQIMPCVEQLMWMPSILFRLNSLLLADELRVKIITEAHIGGDVTGTSLWEPLCRVVTMEHPPDPDDGSPVTD